MRPLVRLCFSIVCAATLGLTFGLLGVLITSWATGDSVDADNATQNYVAGLALFIGAGIGLIVGMIWRRDWQAPAARVDHPLPPSE